MPGTDLQLTASAASAPARRGVVACVLLGLLVLGGVGVHQFSRSGSRARESRPAGAASPARVVSGAGARQPALTVDVAGAVKRPGVYRVDEGARVLDAIAAAGGADAGADLVTINRAALLVDGQQVLVQRRIKVPVGPASVSAVPAGPGVAAAAASSSTPAAPGAKVSLSSADTSALDALPGIGPVTAQRIVDDRLANGPFQSLDDLDRVPGIGPATLAQLEGLVTP